MPTLNKTRYAILGVLSMSPGSGYDIKKFCDQGISHFWNENFGHIYPMLRLMEKEGVITKTVEQHESKPDRNVYAVTAKGQQELADWLLLPTEHTPARLELLLKLSFSRNIPPEKVIAELERVRDNHVQRLAQYEIIEANFRANEKTRSDPGYPYWLATLRFGIYDARFRIQWCDETIQNIREHAAHAKI